MAVQLIPAKIGAVLHFREQPGFEPVRIIPGLQTAMLHVALRLQIFTFAFAGNTQLVLYSYEKLFY